MQFDVLPKSEFGMRYEALQGRSLRNFRVHLYRRTPPCNKTNETRNTRDRSTFHTPLAKINFDEILDLTYVVCHVTDIV